MNFVHVLQPGTAAFVVLTAATAVLSGLAWQKRSVGRLGIDPVIAEAAPALADPVLHVDDVAIAADAQSDDLKGNDPLTGLPNRQHFASRMQTAIRHARSDGGSSSLLLIDLDGFRQVNDLHGQQAGDMVLCEIARRLEGMLTSNDLLARLGVDEFAVITGGHDEVNLHQDKAAHLAGRLLHLIKQPITVLDTSLRIGASIGIALCRPGTSDAGLLLRSASRAMLQVKQGGNGNFGFFEQRIDDQLREREVLETELRQAIIEDAIEPYFQPIIDIRSNKICGFEALARWNHPIRGLVLPDVFVPDIERLGLMQAFTDSILVQACRAAKSWPDDVHVAVNFSASELDDPNRPQRILQILARENFDPKRLQVEITETALAHSMATAKATLATLHAANITVCLDDFGTGYASLSQLRELKFNKLKIDRSFVQAMLVNDDCDKIVNAVLGLANSLKLQTVAEGIETMPVLASLRDKGCRFGQGYLFGEALSRSQAGDMLRKRYGSISVKKTGTPHLTALPHSWVP